MTVGVDPTAPEPRSPVTPDLPEQEELPEQEQHERRVEDTGGQPTKP
jgi:hypothetical protein